MSAFRMAKGVTERYTSLEDLRKGFGLKPVRKKTTDANKLKDQQERFVGKCKVCGEKLTWVEGTNVLACKNENCKGIRMSSINEDGEEKVWYIPVVRRLDEDGLRIAERLFS